MFSVLHGSLLEANGGKKRARRKGMWECNFGAMLHRFWIDVGTIFGSRSSYRVTPQNSQKEKANKQELKKRNIITQAVFMGFGR
jgi:hypothetical protein